MTTKHSGECPYCRNTVKPNILEKNSIRRDLCECPDCLEKILVCRTPGCSCYAKGGENYDDELCPSCTEGLTSGAGEVVKYGLMAAAAVVATAVAAKVSGEQS